MITEYGEDYKVYKHTFPNGKVYIGITSQKPKSRWANGKGYQDNKRMYNAIKKYGWNNIKHEILFTGLTQEQAFEKEIELIAEYDSTKFDKGYNISHGGAYEIMSLTYDYAEMLLDYKAIKDNPFKKLLLLKLFEKAIGYKYQERVDIEEKVNGKVVYKETKYIDKEIMPEIELCEMLYQTYKDEEELKPYIEKVKQILEGNKK